MRIIYYNVPVFINFYCLFQLIKYHLFFFTIYSSLFTFFYRSLQRRLERNMISWLWISTSQTHININIRHFQLARHQNKRYTLWLAYLVQIWGLERQDLNTCCIKFDHSAGCKIKEKDIGVKQLYNSIS